MSGLTDLRQDTVEEFWNSRAQRTDLPLLNRAMFQEKHGDLAQRRDGNEKIRVKQILDPYLPRDVVALDAGCGTGRLTFWLAKFCTAVVGFDLSSGFIELCKEQQERDKVRNASFFVRSLTDFWLGVYDLIVISGVCLHTTDEMWPEIMHCLERASKPGTLIVIRESMGKAGRYSLENVWSAELETYYSAIYRDPDWFLGLFGQFCDVYYNEPLFPASMEKWRETEQRLMLFRRRG